MLSTRVAYGCTVALVGALPAGRDGELPAHVGQDFVQLGRFPCECAFPRQWEEAAKALCTATARSPDHRATHADCAAGRMGAGADDALWREQAQPGGFSSESAPNLDPNDHQAVATGAHKLRARLAPFAAGCSKERPAWLDVCPSTAAGAPRRHASTCVGAALRVARQAKERTYPELRQSRRCRLVVLGIECAGRWSAEAASFTASSPAAGRAQGLPHRALPAHPPTSSVGRDCLRAQPPVPFCPACSACPCQPQPMLMETHR